MALALLCAQVHLCLPTFQTAGGEPCATCPTLPDAEDVHHDGEVEGPHGDCHDCCVLAPCSSDHASQPADGLNPGLDVQAVVGAPPEALVPSVGPAPPRPPVFSDGFPATGPPGLAEARAPPLR